eukprot:CAMPEP_0172771404 /NCGR_PEP_ID=MMETSP1074-20121228/190500_1 /TAXON_ID=2916 /ORGANISM="Ceratium fusus, Strain PA161109" /LENGTH=66 /DNA_ID=CAMNT_0013607325 /DNA_START=229 /DNA_END=429 /DNA_ORIENTATION=-
MALVQGPASYVVRIMEQILVRERMHQLRLGRETTEDDRDALRKDGGPTSHLRRSVVRRNFSHRMPF